MQLADQYSLRCLTIGTYKNQYKWKVVLTAMLKPLTHTLATQQHGHQYLLLKYDMYNL